MSARTMAGEAKKELLNVVAILDKSANLAQSGAFGQAAELGAMADQGTQLVIAEALVAIALALTETPQPPEPRVVKL